jgi:hypothetical protein
MKLPPVINAYAEQFFHNRFTAAGLGERDVGDGTQLGSGGLSTDRSLS